MSLIQSNYEGFGSGLVIPELGFGLQDRGTLFNMENAPTVFPCRRLHLRKEGLRIWCTICSGASPVAKAKLVAVRGGIVVLAAPPPETLDHNLSSVDL